MALSRHHAAAANPLSVKEVVNQAEDFNFSPDVPLKRWLRAAKMLLTEAAICEQDGNLMMAYLYLYRHSVLVLIHLPRHPDYRDAHFQPDLAEARRAVVHNLKKLEAWKPVIEREYQAYRQAKERHDAERKRLQVERDFARTSLEPSQRNPIKADDEVYDDGGQSLNAGEHSALAVDLAHRELSRRDASRRSTRQAGISPGTVASRRKGYVDVEAEPNEVSRQTSYDDYFNRDSGVREAGRYVQGDRRETLDFRIPARRPTSSHAYNYPSVPAREEAMDWKMRSLQPNSARRPFDGAAPARPVKEANSTFMPPLPPKPTGGLSPRSATATPSPPPVASHVPSKYTFKPSAFTEAGDPLRTVMLPPELRLHFLNLAHPNTLRNLETCGILCGTLISNALFINHLIIPDQKSTSDTCDTTEEGDNALFDYCDSKDLLVCGWIHSHPSQSCFLSSRDLHTSSGYQVMLPEAIAIVCAPRHNPDWGIFRLTAPPGLQAVLQCHQSGLFHPHAESNLYTDALRPGHVVEGPGLNFEVVDMRRD